jgi:hypothetical protein
MALRRWRWDRTHPLICANRQLLSVRAGAGSDLRRWGLKLAERGGKNGKKRAVIAVARKLAVLLHRLWVSGEAYEPLRNHPQVEMATAA